MNTMFWKFLLGLSLCLLTFSAHALWKCQSSNFRGQNWDAVFESRSQAARMSIVACRANSGMRARRTCDLDYCRRISSHSLRGAWQCNASNIHGRTWFAIAATRNYARNIALSYCRNNGKAPRTCHINACFRK